MATIKPFRAVRATRDKVALVSSKSYNSYSPDELGAQLNFNPFSYLHVVDPLFNSQKKVTYEIRMKQVNHQFLHFKRKQIFIKDEHPCFYIYKKITANHTCCGIIAAASIADYLNDTIKKHENTLEHTKELFKDYLKETGFNAEPVLLTYPDNKAINTILAKYQSKRAEYEFTTVNSKTHLLWIVDDLKDQKKIQKEFEKTKSLYIADGHHRSASCVLLSKTLEKSNSNHTGLEPYNFFMSFLVSESNLKISTYYRLVSDLNGLSKNDFLSRISKHYKVTNLGIDIFEPHKKHEFSMYLDHEYYSLQLIPVPDKNIPLLDDLDAQILYNTILNPILGVKDLRNDNRISYFHNSNNNLNVKLEIDSGFHEVAFGLYPISIEELKAISDSKLKMPPKSTYIEPKLRSGLTMYEFKE